MDGGWPRAHDTHRTMARSSKRRKLLQSDGSGLAAWWCLDSSSVRKVAGRSQLHCRAAAANVSRSPIPACILRRWLGLYCYHWCGILIGVHVLPLLSRHIRSTSEVRPPPPRLLPTAMMQCLLCPYCLSLLVLPHRENGRAFCSPF